MTPAARPSQRSQLAPPQLFRLVPRRSKPLAPLVADAGSRRGEIGAVRHGRITKRKGETANPSPVRAALFDGTVSIASLLSALSSLGRELTAGVSGAAALVSAVALAAPILVVTSSGANGAGAIECDEVSPGTYNCPDLPAPATQTEALTAPSGTELVVTVDPGFSIDTSGSGGNAFTLTSDAGIDFEQTGAGTITATASGARGIYAENSGAGALWITTTGVITGRHSGIEARQLGSGNVTIKARGPIASTNRTILVEMVSPGGAGDVFIEASDVRGNTHAIEVAQGSAGAVTINAMGKVETTGNVFNNTASIDVAMTPPTSGKVTVNTTDSSEIVSGAIGIWVRSNSASGGVEINSTGKIIAGQSGIIVRAGNSSLPLSDRGVNDIDVTVADADADSQNGVELVQFSNGAVNATVTGDVIGQHGVNIFSASDKPVVVRIEEGASARSNRDTDDTYGIRVRGVASSEVIVAGHVAGGAANAISFVPDRDTDDILELRPGFSIDGNVLAEGGMDTLRLGGMGDAAFDLNDIDTGGLTRRYQSFEVFEVVGGSWTFSGATLVAFTVNTGVVRGTGSFGGLTVENGGIVSPGNSIGTLTVAGDVAFNAGSTLQVEVAPDGTSDLLAVGGAATIATTGTTLDVLGLPGDFPQASPTYVVLRADGGVTGQFATVRDNLPDLDFTQTVAATEVQLSYVQTQTPGGGGNGGTGGDNGGLSPKEIHPSALGAGMQGAVLFGETLRRRGGLVANQLSGSSQGATARSALLGFVERPAPESRALPAHALAADMPSLPSEAFAAPRDRWAVWGAVLGQDLSVDADGATPGWDAQTGGLAFGFERHFEGLAFPTLAGLAFGYARSSVDSGASDADIDAFHIGAYAATRAGALTLSGALAYAWQDYAFERVIPVAGTRVIAEGDTDGQTFVASAEAFYDMSHHLGAGWPGQGLRFGPLAPIDAVHGEQDGFTETGAGILDLTVSGTSADQVVTGLGIGFGVDRAMGATLVSLDGRVAWEHVFGDRSISTVSAIPVANAVFTSGSAPVSRDRLAVGVGAAIAFTDTISTELRYDGAFADTGNDHQGTASLTIRF